MKEKEGGLMALPGIFLTLGGRGLCKQAGGKREREKRKPLLLSPSRLSHAAHPATSDLEPVFIQSQSFTTGACPAPSLL